MLIRGFLYFMKNYRLVKLLHWKHLIEKKSSKKPWISPVILKQINVRDKLFESQITNQTQENKVLYKAYQNKLNTILRYENKRYFEKKFKEVEGCPEKKTWD